MRAAIAGLLLLLFAPSAWGQIYPPASQPLGVIADEVALYQGAGCPTSTLPCATVSSPSLRFGQPIQANCLALLSPFPYQQCIDTLYNPAILREFIGASWYPVATLDPVNGYIPMSGSSTGFVFGPGAATIGEPAVWGNTAGTLLNDGLGVTITHNGGLALPSLGSGVQTACLGLTLGGTVVPSSGPCLTGTTGLVIGSTGVGGGTPGSILSVAGGSVLGQVATNGTGNVVLTTNPALVTPNIGAATGTSLTLSQSAVVGSVTPNPTYNLQVAGGPFIRNVGAADTLVFQSGPSAGPSFGATNVLIYPPGGQTWFKGYISGTTLTVTLLEPGSIPIAIGQYVFGQTLPGTQITGGSGTSWTVNHSQTVGSSLLPVIFASDALPSGHQGNWLISNGVLNTLEQLVIGSLGPRQPYLFSQVIEGDGTCEDMIFGSGISAVAAWTLRCNGTGAPYMMIPNSTYIAAGTPLNGDQHMISVDASLNLQIGGGSALMGIYLQKSVQVNGNLGVSGSTVLGSPLGGATGPGTLNVPGVGGVYNDGAAPTGTGAYARANSPSLITPNIGAAMGTSLTVSGQLISSVVTGTAPLSVASTTNVPNLNASSLNGATFAAPGPIGGGTASTAHFTTLTASAYVGLPIGSASVFGVYEVDNSTIAAPGGVLQVIGSSATVITAGTTTVGGTCSTNNLLYNSGGTLTCLATANNGVLSTGAGGAPAISTALPSGLAASNMALTAPTAAGLTVTGSFVATGLVTNADLVNAATTVNGQTCTLGLTCTITATATTITVGTTLVGGSTTGHALYNNSGTLGDFALGSGVMTLLGGAASGSGGPAGTTSPTFVTPVLGAATGTSLNVSGSVTAGSYVGLPIGSASVFGIFKVDNSTIQATAGVLQVIGSAATVVTLGTTTIGGGGVTNQLIYDNAGVLGEITKAASSVLISNGSSVPSWSTTLPNGIAATNMVLTTPNAGTPSAIILTNATGCAISSCVGGLGTGVATLLGGNASGTGGPAGTTSPSFTTPNIGTASGTSLSVTGQLTSTVATGTAPLVVNSTTNIPNLNASSLSGATFASPGPIGSSVASPGTFTTLTGTAGSLTGITSLGIRDTSAAFDVTIAATSSTTLTAGRTLTLDMKNVAHTLVFGATANTITFPNTASYTLIGSLDTGTVTNTMLATGTFSNITGTGTLTAGATGAGFTIALTTSTVTGTLPAANMPNPSATTLGGIESLAAVSHKWINTISTAGVPSATQPATTDLSDIGTFSLNTTGGITASGTATVGTVAGSICATSAGLYLYEAGVNCFAGGSTAFSAITSGTNTTAAMVVGAGATFSFTTTSLPAQAAGTLGIGGVATNPTLGANGEGDIFLSTVNGLFLKGQGSTNDIEISSTSSSVMVVPTGTPDATFTRNVNMNGTFSNFGGASNTAGEVITGGGLVGSSAVTQFSYAASVNTTGVETIWKLAVTNTASGAGALLMNALAGASGTTSEFSVGMTGNVAAAGTLSAAGLATFGSTTAATGSAGEIASTKISASGTAPGAGYAKIEWVAGTTSGTCKLIAYAGTSTTPVTIVDNTGSGC